MALAVINTVKAIYIYEVLKMTDKQNQQLIELLHLKKLELLNEISTVKKKQTPGVNQSDMINRIDLVMEGLA